MSSATPDWTPEQLAGVTTTGSSLLLSAAAGSGKTAVLTERVVHLVTSASPACEIDELLVVAFNEAAALELKTRIGHKLRAAFLDHATERLEKQVALADRAAISTLHAFCARLLRQHFHRVGLDPAFSVLDPDEARLLRQDIAYELFAARYESDADGSFQSFVDDYGDGDDDRLVEQVIRIHSLLTSVLNPHGWCEQAIDRLTHASQVKLADSALGQEFVQLIRDDLVLLGGKIEGAIRQFTPQKPFAPYVPLLTEWQAVVAHWQQVLNDEGLDTLAAEAKSIDEALGARLPSIRGEVPGKEVAKKVIDDVKKHLREGFCRAAGRFDQKQWRQTVASTITPAKILLSLVDELESRYSDAKTQQRAVDFADLERYALRVLSADPEKPGKSPSDVALSLQKRFKHVLVDEYQDINEVQDAILRLVSRESTASHVQPSNLFCVGDVKQSIYRFRLADPRRFIDRYDSTKASRREGQVIDLQANFRSRGPLLEALNGVFRRVMTRAAAEIEYDTAQELKPRADYPKPTSKQQFRGAPIELHLVPAGLARTAAAESDGGDDLEQDEYEAALVAQRILELTGRAGQPPMQVVDRNGTVRDIRPGDIVVLLRSRKYTGERYANTLRRWDIPAHADSGTGFFDSQEISDLMSLLAVLDNQQQDIPLTAVLRGPIGMLPSPEDDLARIRLAHRSPKGLPFHQAVRRYAAEQQDELAAHLRQFLSRVGTWRTMVHQRPVAEVLRSIYDDAGLLTYYSGLPDGDQRVANLEELYRRSAQFGSFARQGLARFLRFLQNLKDDSDLGQPSTAPEGDGVVRIMTVHQSKGLEFPVVIMPNLGRRLNTSDVAGSILADRSRYLALHTVDQYRQIRYPSLASLVLRDTVAAQMTAEEIRVMYVALTRAKEHLVLIGSAKDGAAETMQARWSGHTGPLPAPTVRAAQTPLDWLLPVAAAEPGLFDATWHDAEAIKALAATPGQRKAADQLKPLAELKPLGSIPPSPAAEHVLAQLRYEYPHAPATTLAAARSVTSWTKNPAGRILLEETEVDVEPSGDASTLELPRFLAEGVQPKATDLGTFTHVALEHLDFTRAASAEQIAKQIAGLVDRKLLTEAQAGTVDVAAIEWMMTTEVGRLLRDAEAKTSREIPVYLTGEQFPSSDPADKIMLRGRLDAYVATSEGGVVIDYKTDRVSGQALADRADFYRGQLKAYADAMAAITKQPTKAAYLVFLHPRKVIAV